MYDFIQYFKKDNPSFLPRSDFLEIIEKIFGEQWPVSQLEKDAIIFQVFFIRQTSKDFIHNGPLNIFFHLLQYTDWEHIDDGYLNQKMIGDVVGDFFFVCPCNYFAQQVKKILKKRLKYGNLKIMQRMSFLPLHLKLSIF